MTPHDYAVISECLKEMGVTMSQTTARTPCGGLYRAARLVRARRITWWRLRQQTLQPTYEDIAAEWGVAHSSVVEAVKKEQAERSRT